MNSKKSYTEYYSFVAEGRVEEISKNFNEFYETLLAGANAADSVSSYLDNLLLLLNQNNYKGEYATSALKKLSQKIIELVRLRFYLLAELDSREKDDGE